ncbi:CLUMA_CG018180, isoform A [Clunio marinus]|uniref:CLUMA_CG018180, isoform A n=1 Tax=Clunio marinus TaxID=568069 RepID=A0A1J1IZU1_9DIPT|nr:CLUMA_CG018180, isoform A [Clunio marinus]
MISLLLYFIPVALYFFYKWATKHYDYFERQGVPYKKAFPLLGSNFSSFFKKQPFNKLLLDNYQTYKKEKLYGYFEFRRPAVVLTDLKIIKQLTVKDFDYFMDHRAVVKEEVDPMMTKLLTALEGQKWKDMRATLSPAFTGSKMRQMFDFVSTVGQQTALAMKQDIEKGGNNEFEFKALAMKFTVDVIASCAFGIEVNSFNNPGNKFYDSATRVTNLQSTLQILKFFGYMISPKLMKMLNITFIDKDITDFFREATLETMKVREAKGIIRHDMINLLMEAKKGKLTHNNNNNNVEEKTIEGFATVEESNIGKTEVKRKWEDDDFVAQCILFFFAGFDTVATTMSFMAYELTCNPDIQERLYEEIVAMNDELAGKKITYEKLQGMQYLDQVVTETLRKWPIAPLLERACTKDYVLDYDGKSLRFNNLMNFFIPVYCIHHDPEYYPEPDKFNPGRFSPENRSQINPDAFLPFGIGPRNCIGSRFALMELKTIFFYLLLNFSFEVISKTTIPFEYEKVPFAMKPINGFWIGLKPRVKLKEARHQHVDSLHASTCFRNIAHGKPIILFGTGKDLLLQKLALPEYVEKWYKEFPNEKLIGLFDFRTPFFLIRDPELAKLICIKEFDSFTDHLYTMSEDVDPLLGNALLSLSGDKWRKMRATLSPAFTGSKMRLMLKLVVETTDAAIKSAKSNMKEKENDDYEMKEFFSKFTVDIIASCAFGLEVDTFKNPENDFKKIANETMNPSGFAIVFKFIFLYFIPKVMKLLDISLLSRHTKKFFRDTVSETMNYRENNGIVRPDMIQLLLQAKKGQIKFEATNAEKPSQSIAEVEESEIGKSVETTTWKSDELVAQCLLFFLAGFDTTSTTLAFSAYELAVNSEIQEKLRQEIQDMEASLYGRELSYEELLKMKYLDHFVTEVLRKWSPSPGIERYSVRDFTFDLDGKTITIPKHHSVLIPAHGWHRDPKNFPDPLKFDPERFNDENIGKQNLNAFAPFGIGPRNCIGSRFALMIVKTILYKMLLNFSFDVSEKTQIPLQYKKSMMTVGAEKGYWIKLKSLNSL